MPDRARTGHNYVRPQAMDIDGLLASTAMVDQGGARTLTDRGELVYDLAALTEALRVRCARILALDSSC